MNLQPVIQKYGIKQPGLDISKRLYDTGFYIPSGLALNYEEQEYISDCLLKFSE
jgi:hypothetical protein